jgi:hypothetical protein
MRTFVSNARLHDIDCAAGAARSDLALCGKWPLALDGLGNILIDFKYGLAVGS